LNRFVNALISIGVGGYITDPLHTLV